ncbi:hypothetical protein GOODEAATRI_002821 [Goodea atripinnis]|uniref:Ig-like domain-containing protein n=1 Tax=Goodea atripinnis TaxID=208336 RepID=A0ABV0NH08_9TELE
MEDVWKARLDSLDEKEKSSSVLCAGCNEVPVFTEEPVSMVQKLGGSVMLRCSAQPASAKLIWRLNGEQLLNGDLDVVLGPGSLLIPALTNLTLGRYQCVASTGAGALASVPANVTAASE